MGRRQLPATATTHSLGAPGGPAHVVVCCLWLPPYRVAQTLNSSQLELSTGVMGIRKRSQQKWTSWRSCGHANFLQPSTAVEPLPLVAHGSNYEQLLWQQVRPVFDISSRLHTPSRTSNLQNVIQTIGVSLVKRKRGRCHRPNVRAANSWGCNLQLGYLCLAVGHQLTQIPTTMRVDKGMPNKGHACNSQWRALSSRLP